MTLRIVDSQAEQELAKFLDRNFYPHLHDYIFLRCYGIEEQLKGIDVILTFNTDSSEFLIDEKAQLHYLNNNLPTFAFEIDSIQKGNLTQGWLFNKRYVTTHYLLIYPNAKHDDLRIITENDFTTVECLLIERARIIEYLDECGWNQTAIEENASKIRESNIFGKHYTTDRNFSFYFTKHLVEKPINIILSKRKLTELSCATFIVTNSIITKVL